MADPVIPEEVRELRELLDRAARERVSTLPVVPRTETIIASTVDTLLSYLKQVKPNSSSCDACGSLNHHTGHSLCTVSLFRFDLDRLRRGSRG